MVSLGFMNRSEKIRRIILNRLRKALRQLSTVENSTKKVISLDVTELGGRTTAIIGKTLRENWAIGEIVKIVEKWLNGHPEISAVIITKDRI